MIPKVIYGFNARKHSFLPSASKFLIAEVMMALEPLPVVVSQTSMSFLKVLIDIFYLLNMKNVKDMAKRDIPELIVESVDTNAFSFLSVIEFDGRKHLVVIDNIIGDMVYAYVLDEAIQRKMNLEVLLPIISSWAEAPQEPLSFLFARLGVASQTSLIFKSFEVTGITRLIGCSYKFLIQHNITPLGA